MKAPRGVAAGRNGHGELVFRIRPPRPAFLRVHPDHHPRHNAKASLCSGCGAGDRPKGPARFRGMRGWKLVLGVGGWQARAQSKGLPVAPPGQWPAAHLELADFCLRRARRARFLRADAHRILADARNPPRMFAITLFSETDPIFQILRSLRRTKAKLPNSRVKNQRTRPRS